jgi:hypothetical protein
VRGLARKVLGAETANALLPRLMRSYHGDAEEAETALLAAQEECDPVGYIENDIARQARWNAEQ